MDSGEFKTHTEAVNDALRRAREMETYRETPEEIAFIRDRLEKAKTSGYSTLTRDEIREKAREELRADGKL